MSMFPPKPGPAEDSGQSSSVTRNLRSRTRTLLGDTRDAPGGSNQKQTVRQETTVSPPDLTSGPSTKPPSGPDSRTSNKSADKDATSPRKSPTPPAAQIPNNPIGEADVQTRTKSPAKDYISSEKSPTPTAGQCSTKRSSSSGGQAHEKQPASESTSKGSSPQNTKSSAQSSSGSSSKDSTPGKKTRTSSSSKSSGRSSSESSGKSTDSDKESPSPPPHKRSLPKKSAWEATAKEKTDRFDSRVRHYTEQLKQNGLEQTLNDLRHYAREGIKALEQNLINPPSENKEPRGLTHDEINMAIDEVASDEETLMQSAETVGRKLAQLEQGTTPSSPIDRNTPWDWQPMELYEEDFVSGSEYDVFDEESPIGSDEDDDEVDDGKNDDDGDSDDGDNGNRGNGADGGDLNSNDKSGNGDQHGDGAAKDTPPDTGEAKSPFKSRRNNQSSKPADGKTATPA
ncbi:hypothetical protein LTS18_012912, partial [Coniosporium uncinatum]